MALDVYWKNYQTASKLGSIEIDTPLENLLYDFGQQVGFPVDPYGSTRLYPTQWERLIVMADSSGFPTQQLRHIQAAIPADQPQGILILEGD
ncbi:hypothetical protein [Hymenobacter cellulosilyticus]|uniref:Uncharacterized protein n=1 Tax=Hymenobacter cellulosilyticus TaxID=2932248 RepID=A0A8T9Q4Z1_9BACT|nr:hypothetical protein [Hymenobacter cellulosilyticus]UOQ70163.1 hypothetical protein MUN79_15480 [Hymenobacter cellulosilyticus]